MRIVTALALLLLVAPAARAEEIVVPADRVTPSVVQTSEASDVPTQPALRLEQVKISDARVADTEAVVQDMPSRGSFWWLVGVIVIAGIILAVVLD